MSFKKFILILAEAGLSLSCLAGSPPDFVAETFGSVPQVRQLQLRGDVASVAASIMRGRYARPAVDYWRENGRTVWILEARGKKKMIDAGFVIEQGRIVNSQVLEYRETRGKQICSLRFLKQFFGASLTEHKTLSLQIDGYSGATYSVNAMKKMARLALFLDLSVPPEMD